MISIYIVFFSHSDGIGWVLLNIMNLMMNIYILVVKPLNYRMTNLQEIANEFIILYVSLIMCLLTDFTYLHVDRVNF